MRKPKPPIKGINADLLEMVNAVPEFRRMCANYKHGLPDILLLDIMARLCRCVSRPDIIAFGKRHIRKLKSMGICHNGIPSEPTFSRVFKAIDDSVMARLYSEFADKFCVKVDRGLKVVAVDGKCMRGTEREDGRCPDVVSAYSVDEGITLGTEMCDGKSNEITAAPKLLERLDLTGAVVTSDAMLCQKDIIDGILDGNGHFLVEVKANQKALRWSLEDRLVNAKPYDTYTQEPELMHGRIECRTCSAYHGADLVVDSKKWGAALTVVTRESVCTSKKDGTVSVEKRIYISDLQCDAETFESMSRRHWRIESMHWRLDRNMKQDSIRRKSANAARNLDTIQRLCLSMLSIWKKRRRKCADRKTGDITLLRKCSLDFSFLKRVMLLN